MRLTKSIAAAALVAVTAVAPLPAHAAGAWYSCTDALNQLHVNMACLDPTSGAFGSTIVVVTSAGTVLNSFGVTGTASGIASFYATPAEWQYLNLWFTGAPYNGFGTGDSTQVNCATNPTCVSVTPGNHDVLEWYSNAAGWSFVKVN